MTMKTSIPSRGLIAAGSAVALALLADSPASTQPVTDDVVVEGTLTRIVPYGDLDLHTAAGQMALRNRVYAAAWEICSVLHESPSAFEYRTGCARETVADARPQYRAAIQTARLGLSSREQLALVLRR